MLYAGLMMTNQGPKVLEYNVRFGDPECQPLLMRLKTDLVDVLEATVDGRLDEIEPAGVGPAAGGLRRDGQRRLSGRVHKGPSDPRPGRSRRSCPTSRSSTPARDRDDGQVVTAGGRVLGVTALGDSIAQAKLQAYTAVKCIRWPGAWCRKDISDKAMGWGG